ncbi:Hypothetical predicted protein [Marmota monax]|uniref:Uncharacterized protein n=1 Tax=Marmota monax TaxID=9995 RepID=A0A5E4B1A8_MARMO|nr:hypothetical protein GHT09_009208 [Marmota monax]VTJ62412.1 Hypothetical predicted protein [Marmota monax]
MDVKAAPNGVATIEDRILRITGYYGYYPGYSSQKSKTPWGRPARGADGRWALMGATRVREGGGSGHLQPLPVLSPPPSWPRGPLTQKVYLLSSVLNLVERRGSGGLRLGVWEQSQSWGRRCREDLASSLDRRWPARPGLIYAWRRLTWLFN